MTTKSNRCCSLFADSGSPRTAQSIAKEVGCSVGTARKAIETRYNHMIYIANLHVGSGNFRCAYFPLGWTLEECQTWLDKRTKSGKSKAHVRRLGGDRDIVPVKKEPKHEAFDLMTEPFWNSDAANGFIADKGILDGVVLRDD